jgi:transposase
MPTYNKYEAKLKEKVLRLYLEEGRRKKSLTEEYDLGQGTYFRLNPKKVLTI